MKVTTTHRYVLQTGVLLFGLHLALVSSAGPRPETELERVFYDIGVVGYCGLVTDAVSQGFRREVRRIVERDAIDERGLNAARSRAMTLVELEWDNRGLGGFRGWCRTEGEDAVKRFLAVPPSQ